MIIPSRFVIFTVIMYRAHKFPKHLHGGALLFALLLSLLLAVTTGALFLLLRYHQQYAADLLREERLQQNLASAVNLLITAETTDDIDTARISLFDGKQDSVILIQKPWGIFDVGIACAFEQRDSLQQAFMIGRVPKDAEKYALYLADEYRPISISGDTRIRGDAYLPEAGIRKAYIENRAYTGEEVIFDGTILQSTPTLPPLNDAIIARLSPYLQPDESPGWQRNARDWFADPTTDSIQVPFAEPVLLLHAQDSLAIDGQTVRGQVLLVSDKSITVKASATLDNVLLFAPTIRFAAGFRGRVQAFARDSLFVGNDCRFGYPSALGLVNLPNDSVVYEFQPFIQIDSASVVNGLVFSHYPGSEQLLAMIRIAPDATVHGQVYADGLLELQGTVYGITACRRFTLQTPSSLYENFILDGVMDGTRLSPYYGGSPLLHTGRLGNVLTWLDKERDQSTMNP